MGFNTNTINGPMAIVHRIGFNSTYIYPPSQCRLIATYGFNRYHLSNQACIRHCWSPRGNLDPILRSDPRGSHSSCSLCYPTHPVRVLGHPPLALEMHTLLNHLFYYLFYVGLFPHLAGFSNSLIHQIPTVARRCQSPSRGSSLFSLFLRGAIFKA